MEDRIVKNTSQFLSNFRRGVWFAGVPSWLFGIADRSIASLADGYVSAIEICQIFTAAFFFVCWLFLKPTLKRFE